MKSLILQTASRFLIVVLVVFSVFMVLRGHNEPGGGFIGGLLMSSAFALYALAYDVKTVRRLLGVPPQSLIGAGLLVALISGMVGTGSGGEYLEGRWLATPVPGVGKLGTPLLFDVGVFLVVVGTALTILLNLTEETE